MMNRETVFFEKYNELKNAFNSGSYNWHRRTSGILRFLFIDNHANLVSKEKKTPIFFNVDPTFDLSTPNSEKVDGSKLSYVPTELVGLNTIKAPTKRISLGKFKNLKILKIEEKLFSVEELIKLFANRYGGVHLDVDEASSKLYQRNKNAFDNALRSICYYTIDAMEELASLCSTFPPYEYFLFHYDASPKEIEFDGSQHLENRSFNALLENSLLMIMRVRFLNQVFDPAVFLAIKGELGFELLASVKDRRLLVDTKFGNTQLLCETKQDFTREEFNLSMVVHNDGDEIVSQIFYGSTLFGENRTHGNFSQTTITEMTLGTDLMGKNGCAFTACEFFALSNIEPSMYLKRLDSYLSAKYTH